MLSTLISIGRTVATTSVGIGAGAIAKAAIDNVKPTDVKPFMKACVAMGQYGLCGLAASKASEYVGNEIDTTVNEVSRILKTLINEDETNEESEE